MQIVSQAHELPFYVRRASERRLHSLHRTNQPNPYFTSQMRNGPIQGGLACITILICGYQRENVFSYKILFYSIK